MGMTLRKRLFVENYKACKNATKAARDAGYSEKSSSDAGHRLLKDKEISKIIADWEKEVLEAPSKIRSRITQEVYELEAWETYLKEDRKDVKFKYFEIFGKSRGFLKMDGDSGVPSVSINFIGSELSFHLPGKEAKTEPAQLITAKISDNSHAKKHN